MDESEYSFDIRVAGLCSEMEYPFELRAAYLIN